MRFDSNKLPKETLALIVDQFRPGAISDQRFANFLRIDKRNEYYIYFQKAEKINKQLDSKELSGRSKKVLEARNKLIKQYNSLATKAAKAEKLIKEIEQHYPELKEKNQE